MSTHPPFLCSDLLQQHRNITHGFFGREGGVSGGIYASLNCGSGSRDEKALVQQNRARVKAAMGGEILHTVYQCHTAQVLTIDAAFSPSDTPADAMVTTLPNIVLGILTADCAPVLLCDAEARVIGAAHAGWKGAATGVVENTIAAMEQLGAKRTQIVAAIGPCIGQASYEVGPEFVERLAHDDVSNLMFFSLSSKAGHSMFDLAGYVESRLHAAGVEQVEVIARDTCAEDDKFFSYRRSCLRSEPDYGREISCIMLKE